MFRIGIGYDIHSFSYEETDYIMLGGVAIPFNRKIIAHSDGDVILHALTDGLLGAIAEGSIGVHFPNTDKKWKNASSSEFVKYTLALMHSKDYIISNVDITVISHEPKVMPYSLEIRKNIAQLIQCDISQVNVKATTPERLGALGRKEGIASQAAVLIIKR